MKGRQMQNCLRIMRFLHNSASEIKFYMQTSSIIAFRKLT